MRGLVFSKQFPNPAEPLRGLFVADQVRATRGEVEWTVIAPVPFIPRLLAGPLGKPYVAGDGRLGDVPVVRPRYLVLPRRLLYGFVATSMARAARRAFARAVDTGRPEFVHAHALYPSGAAASRLAATAGVPLIVTVHGSDLYSNLAKDSWRASLAATVATARLLICVSPSLARDVIAELEADPRKVVVVPDCYDEATFCYDGEEPHREGPLRLVSVGRLVPVKGFDVLLGALRRVTDKGLDAVLTLVGDGPERAALETQAAELGISERVRFTGALPGEELAALLRETDAFVSSSRREGFGVAIVEALASGLPVVATRSGGPESIVGPDDGILCAADDTDALAACIAEMGSRLGSLDRSAIAARARSRFSRDAVGAQLLGLYRRVAAGEEHFGADAFRG